MKIPTLGHACYKHYRSTVVKACPCCDDVQFPEERLCDLARECLSVKQPFRCAAFRPAVSVVQQDHTEARHREEVSADTGSMSLKDKWFRAYAVQPLRINSDLSDF